MGSMNTGKESQEVEQAINSLLDKRYALRKRARAQRLPQGIAVRKGIGFKYDIGAKKGIVKRMKAKVVSSVVREICSKNGTNVEVLQGRQGDTIEINVSFYVTE